jgi:hypothetical protein
VEKLDEADLWQAFRNRGLLDYDRFGKVISDPPM